MQIISLPEYSSIPLSEIRNQISRSRKPDFYLRSELISSGFLRVEKRPNNGGALEDHIFSAGKIGLIPLCDEVALWVESRVPINNLDYMVKHFGGVIPDDYSFIRQYLPSPNHSDEMFETIGDAFVSKATAIRLSGLLRSYSDTQNPQGQTSGRIDFAKTMRTYQSRGVDYAAVSFSFRKSPLNEANIGIQFALQYLASALPMESTLRNRALRELEYYSKTTGIRHVARKPCYAIAKKDIPTSRALYFPALTLAESIVSGVDLNMESSSGPLDSINLLVDMSETFERYIRSVLSGLEHEDGFSVIDGNKMNPSIYLFEDRIEYLPNNVKNTVLQPSKSGGNNELKPDILIRINGENRLVTDVKYKPIFGNYSAKRSDIEQVVTYATRMSLRYAVTVHPCRCEQKSGIYYSGSIGCVDLFCYLFDLASDDMDREEQMLISSLQTLAMNQ